MYKGMLRSVVVGQFFLDLKNEAFETGFAIYHRRFSTNTNPKWPLAQPMRVLGHNGEINTVQVPSPPPPPRTHAILYCHGCRAYRNPVHSCASGCLR